MAKSHNTIPLFFDISEKIPSEMKEAALLEHLGIPYEQLEDGQIDEPDLCIWVEGDKEMGYIMDGCLYRVLTLEEKKKTYDTLIDIILEDHLGSMEEHEDFKIFRKHINLDSVKKDLSISMPDYNVLSCDGQEHEVTIRYHLSLESIEIHPNEPDNKITFFIYKAD